MKIFAVLGSAMFSVVLASNVWAAQNYPMGPDPRITPGAMCENGKNRRHPQSIPYCSRSVSSSDKWEVIGDYNKLGYDINSKNRGHFKIDHLIPLCIGGANSHENLWPQHESIYVQTDDVEHMTCALVSQGSMKQREAIDLVLRAKHNLNEAAAIKRDLESRLGRGHGRL